MAIYRVPARAFEKPAPPEEPAPIQGTEKRGAARRRVLFGGKIVFAAGTRTIDCTIRDLSETGAQVRLASADFLPEQVYLLELRTGVARQARVAWIRPPNVGLVIFSAHSLNDPPATPEFAAMRRLWLEYVPRASP